MPYRSVQRPHSCPRRFKSEPQFPVGANKRQQGRLSQGEDQQVKSGASYERSHSGAFGAWAHIVRFVSESAYFKEVWPRIQREAEKADKQRPAPVQSREVVKTRPSIDMER